MKPKKAIINKILYTVGNDLALFCLLVAVYYLPRIIPYNLALILSIIVFITAVFCFYLVRVFTVIGDIYDEDYNAVSNKWYKWVIVDFCMNYILFIRV